MNHNIHKRKHVMKLVHVLKCLKGLWHGCLVTRLYSLWTWYQVKEWQNHSFFQTKYVSQALYQTLQTTKMNFESLLGEQVFKNHNCNPFQSSLSLTIRAYFCITLACKCFAQFAWVAISTVWVCLMLHISLLSFLQVTSRKVTLINVAR